MNERRKNAESDYVRCSAERLGASCVVSVEDVLVVSLGRIFTAMVHSR